MASSFCKGAAEAPLTPQGFASTLRASLESFNPGSLLERDILTWGAQVGLDTHLRIALDPTWAPRYAATGERLTDAHLTALERREGLHRLISRHPERLREIEEAVGELQRHWLKTQADRLEACGTFWRGQIVRIFWRDRRGRERLRRQIGVHRCKSIWCPTCGRSRQARIAAEVEKFLVLAEYWGFHAGHARLITLTVPNGSNVAALREEAHAAFARLQRTRWWNRHVFGFVRGTEVVTGENRQWNFHLHLLVLFWYPRMDYADLGDHWTASLGGTREGGRKYVVDCDALEAKAWERRDGQEGRLVRRNLVRAARYISKYLCKAEDVKKLQAGPGGLAHLLLATKGLRKASFGGGCAVLRRIAHVLMPRQLHAAEEALAERPLHEGRPALRVEILNPDTGELIEVEPFPLNPERDRALRAWGEVLETNPEPKAGWKLPGRVVGVPCGPHGRHRRLGAVPLAGSAPTVKAFEAWERGHGISPLHGVRTFIADGDWKVFRWDRFSRKTGRTLHYAAVLPARRYAWRPIQATISQLLSGDAGGALRARALTAYGDALKAPALPASIVA